VQIYGTEQAIRGRDRHVRSGAWREERVAAVLLNRDPAKLASIQADQGERGGCDTRILTVAHMPADLGAEAGGVRDRGTSGLFMTPLLRAHGYAQLSG
jgi:hypothetical protein